MSGDQLQPEDTLEDLGVDDVLDEGYSPPAREPDHLQHPEGGESLEERLDDEEPETWEQEDKGVDEPGLSVEDTATPTIVDDGVS